MEEHCIIGGSTLLSKGLGFYLKNFESINVILLDSDENIKKSRRKKNMFETFEERSKQRLKL